MPDHTKWKTKLHLMPPTGWLNDPNGLCQFGGIYHVFFQYRPEDAFGNGNTGWGHYTSPDLIHWTFQGTPLVPDQFFDQNGVYSGSALIDQDSMFLYYTGNVKIPGDFDYTYSGREANVVLVSSGDGVEFGEKELLLTNDSYPAGCTCHVRDPKVWRDGDDYYMVLGARFRGNHGDGSADGTDADTSLTDWGGVLLYHSTDRRHWNYCNTITSPGRFGYMWECPDLFPIGGTRLLSISPQGLDRERNHFQNVYQSGYFTVTGDVTGDYTLSEFREWDMGFDFYAPQTFCDEQNRRILIGWMGLPDIGDEYQNPTVKDGWQHVLTIPRELYLSDSGAVCQRPVSEFETLRGEKHAVPDGGMLETKAPFDMVIVPDDSKQPLQDTVITLYGSLRICCSPSQGEYSLTFLPPADKSPSPGCGRTVRRAKIPAETGQIRILCDTSAVEIFFGDGETVMSTRIYPAADAPATVCVEGGFGWLWEMGTLDIQSSFSR